MIGVGQADETAVAVQETDLDVITAVRLGVDVPGPSQILEHDVIRGGGLPFFGGVIDPKHGDNALPTSAEFREVMPLMFLLDLPLGIDPIRIADEKIDLVIAVIVRKLAWRRLIIPRRDHWRYDHGFRDGQNSFFLGKDRRRSFFDGDPLES